MCASGIAKCLLIGFNIGFFLLGGGLLAAGILIITDTSVITSVLANVPQLGTTLDQAAQASNLLSQSAYVLIGVGAVIFVIGFCGCCGAMKEVRILLFVYALIVIILLLAQIAIVVLGVIYQTTVTTYARSFLNDTISQKYEGLVITGGSLTESVEPYSAAWDILMISLECCGNYNYSDFADYAVNWNRTYGYSASYTISNVPVPISCCKTTSKTALLSDMSNFANYFTNATTCLTTADPTSTNTENCYDKILYYINTYTYIALGVVGGIVLVELIAIIAACSLIRAIGKDSIV